MPLADIDHSIEIDESIERVWTVLTGEALVEEWLGCIHFKQEVGALFFMQQDAARRAAKDPTGATHCEIVELAPPTRMSFSWFLPGTPKTYVDIVLTARSSGKTVVRLLHRGWDQFDEASIKPVRDMLNGGWSSYVLPGLKRVAENPIV